VLFLFPTFAVNQNIIDMGRFNDEHGHTRWQEGKKDVREFLNKHPGIAGDILEAVLEITCPRIADVVEAIRKVRNCEVPASEKIAAISALKKLKKDLNEEA
jgi:hypothetical protein